jgi:hypothetical protein
MILRRRRGLHGVQVAWRACRLTAGMGFRHPHVPALFRHLLATLALGRRHSRTGQCARRDRLRDQHQRQSGNTELDQYLQTSPVYLQLTIRRNKRRKVSVYLRHLVGQPNLHATAVTLVAPAKPVLPVRLNDLIVPIRVETESAVYQPQNQSRKAFSSWHDLHLCISSVYGSREKADGLQGSACLAGKCYRLRRYCPSQPWPKDFRHVRVARKSTISSIHEIPATMSVANFVADPQYIQQTFATSEPFFTRQAGIETRVLLVSEIGYNPFRVMFTTRDFLRQHPETVAAFVRGRSGDGGTISTIPMRPTT